METGVLILSLLAVAVSLFLLIRSFHRPPDPSFLLMQQQIDQLRQHLSDSLSSNTSLMQQQLSQMSAQVNNQLSSVNQQLTATTGQIGNRLDNAARVVGEVKQNLGELTKATQQVYEVGKNISSLQEILRAPKLRGTLGELFLGDLLSQVLPVSHFSLQYRFKNNEAVDAIIKLGPGLVPVDSKFPLENFRKIVESVTDEEKKGHRRKFLSDVRKHVDHIASKYILPDEGTYDFALMYIPAENVYYETIIKDEASGDNNSLCGYALAKRVIPVSPNSFYAYLQVIILGFKGLHIEKSAKEIHQRLQQLGGDFDKFKKDFDVVGSHISNARGKYDDAVKKLDRLGDRLLSAGQESMIDSKNGEITPAEPIAGKQLLFN